MIRKLRRRAVRLFAVGLELSGKALARSKAKSKPAPLPPSPASVDVNGMRVVITGGTRGVGQALAKGFADAGARVAILARNGTEAAAVAKTFGPLAIGLEADVTDPIAMDRAFAQIDARFGGVDLLINNAGVPGTLDRAAWDVTATELSDVMAVNLVGAHVAAQSAIKLMRSRGISGRIINVSSGAVNRPTAGMTAYAVSKYALEGLTRQLAVEADRSGISVAAIRLGSVRTAMTTAAFGATKASLLPDPDTVVPAFLTLARAPKELVQGRSFAGWHLLADPEAELRTANPLAHSRAFTYPNYTHNGRSVSRTDPAFRIYDRAENQFGPSPAVAAAISADLTSRPIAIYPDETHAPLRAALSDHMALAPDCFAIGNGSWELLDRLLEIFTQSGDEVIGGKPGWFGFQMLCDKRALVSVKVPMMLENGKLQHDLKAVAAAISPATRLIYLISPSNPEGIILRRTAFQEFLALVPKEIPILLDEAYFEYCNDPDAITARDVIGLSDRPIFGLRTFSKFYALASMRVGYAYGRAEHIALLNRGERIFNIAHLSEIAAVAALKDHAHSAYVLDANGSQRKMIQDHAIGLGLQVIDSQTCFILIELPCPLEDLIDLFAQDGIFLPGKAYYKAKYFMFPVSTEPENRRNLALLAKAVKKG